jgi:nudix-type nucleoside diphosphatase (YffH/AdpP family)
MSNDARSVILRNKHRIYDGVFKLDEITVSHSQFDGTMSADRNALIFERGDSVGALLMHRDRPEVILVEQFRAPTWARSDKIGWMIEAVAGVIEEGETAEQAIAREVFEETGYRVTSFEPIATYFASPGASSERVSLYYAVVTDVDKVGPGGGNRTEGEDVRVVAMKPRMLFDRIERREVDDPKLLIAAAHLKQRIRIEALGKKVLDPETVRFAMKSSTQSGPPLVIGVKTGRILDIKGIDVWVNSENTDMMMDRIIDHTISANIRYGGAEKDDRRVVREDTIGNELRDRLRGRAHMPLTGVISTGSGALLLDNDVKTIVHVAAVHGIPGQGTAADINAVGPCLTEVLRHIDRQNRTRRWFATPHRSVLVPLLAAGDGGLDANAVAPKLVEAAIRYFSANRQAALREIYLLAYRQFEKDACVNALEQRPELGWAK